ncbi:PepSY domain-containing protein [Sciscionella marina]|uniref:PepSY domain-containing protein n=1 Tax=Sciscionella marina TaxID=508770 RepID=UPI000381180A|nr:PepSY domain-containing protein [Sciscionella marina]
MMRKTVITVAAVGAFALAGTGVALASTAGSTAPGADQTISQDQGTGQQNTGQAQAAGTISKDQAVRTAQAKVPQARVTEAELDHENGVLIWEIDLENPSTEYEVDVDAHTGAVLKVDQDDNDGRDGVCDDD